MKLFSLPLMAFLILSSLATADTDSHEDNHDFEFTQHHAHQHGLSNASISYTNQQIQVSITLPAANVFGFEHSAINEKEQAVIDDALATLSSVDKIVSLHPECNVLSHQIHHEIHKDEHTDHHEHNHSGHDDEHSDITLESLFSCDTNQAIKLTFNLFENFPSLEKINIQFISDHHQDLYSATAANNSFTIK